MSSYTRTCSTINNTKYIHVSNWLPHTYGSTAGFPPKNIKQKKQETNCQNKNLYFGDKLLGNKFFCEYCKNGSKKKINKEAPIPNTPLNLVGNARKIA